MSSMTLNIQVEGDPTALRAAARWLTELAKETDEAARQVHLARIDSEEGWEGTAADGFRSVMAKARDDAGDVVTDLERTGRALSLFADELEGCGLGMQRAREIAAKAGLPTTDTTVDPPGSPPAAPQGLGMGPYTGEQGRAYKAYLGARNHYAAQVKAYYQAAAIAAFVRRKERQAQTVLLDFLDNFSKTSPFTATDLSVAVVGTVVRRTSRFLAAAEKWNRRADLALKLSGHPDLADRPWLRRRLAVERASALQEARLQEQRALNTKLAHALNNSRRARMLLNPDLPMTQLQRVPGLREIAPITKGIPLAGWVITGSAIGWEAGQGKDPVKAAASDVGGTIAGSAVGGAVSGSVGGPFGTAAGLVVGTLVGAGVGYSIDRWGDDIVDRLGDAATGTVKGIGEGIKGLGEGPL